MSSDGGAAFEELGAAAAAEVVGGAGVDASGVACCEDFKRILLIKATNYVLDGCRRLVKIVLAMLGIELRFIKPFCAMSF